MLRDVEAGKIDLIAFVRLDRWFRSVQEYYKVNEILERHRVAWTAIQEDYETQSAGGQFKTNIMLAVAQSEADRTGERIRAVFDMKREKGESLGGLVPLGISVVGKHRQPNDDAPKVKALYDYYLATHSMRQAAQNSEELFERRIGYEGVKTILSNESYVDVGVIDRKTFDRVQEIRSERAPRATKSDRVYLFSGLARCAVCGRRLSAHALKDVQYYRCPRASDSGICSNRRHVRESNIEQYLLDNIGAELIKIRTRAKKVKPPDTAAIKRKMDKLTDLYMSDLITREKYEADYKALRTRLNASESHIAPPDVESLTSVLDAYRTLSRQAQRAFWYTVINRVDCADAEPKSFTLRA